MKFSIEELNDMIHSLNENILKPIRIDRGKRYGSPEDTLANVREADFIEKDGWRGAFGSLVECKNRLQNYARTLTTEMTDEQIRDFENACEDLVNYAFYVWILFNQKLNCHKCNEIERE